MSLFSCRRHRIDASLLVAGAGVVATLAIGGCKRAEAPPDLVKTQRESMERAKEVGKTMQKSVDEQGKKADEESK